MEANNKSIRDALSDTVGLLESILEAFSQGTGGPYMVDVAESIDNAHAALSKPQRNCDMGTPDEQSERFKNFCRNHQFISGDSEDGFPPVYVCSNESCPLHGYYIVHGEDNCELAWAQMPYEGDKK